MKKTELIARLIREVEPRWPLPEAPREGFTLLEHGAVVVLMRHTSQANAEASVVALKGAYEDWNEARVSQAQELGGHLRLGTRRKAAGPAAQNVEAARTVKDYLQEVFQKTHGLDLEAWRDDPAGAGKLIAQMPVLGQTGGGYLLWIAHEGRVPVHLGLVRLLDRLGIVARTNSVAKAREQIEPLVPKGAEREFTIAMHEIAEGWNDPEEPIYLRCEVLLATAYGKKAHGDLVQQRKRAEAHRKRDEQRQQAFEKREAERQRREDQRARKRAEAEAKRRARELERRQRADEKRREREAEAKKKAVAKKKADTRKKPKKKAVTKAGSKRKTGAVQPALRKAKAPAKKKTTKKGSAKKATTRKPTARRSATKRPARRR